MSEELKKKFRGAASDRDSLLPRPPRNPLLRFCIENCDKAEKRDTKFVCICMTEECPLTMRKKFARYILRQTAHWKILDDYEIYKKNREMFVAQLDDVKKERKDFSDRILKKIVQAREYAKGWQTWQNNMTIKHLKAQIASLERFNERIQAEDITPTPMEISAAIGPAIRGEFKRKEMLIRTKIVHHDRDTKQFERVLAHYKEPKQLQAVPREKGRPPASFVKSKRGRKLKEQVAKIGSEG
jgi:hypothetical protein